MIRYLIDTDISSYFLKKRDPSLDRRMRAALMANAVAISAITRAELRYGQALLPSDAAKRRALIDAFIAEAPVLDWGSRGKGAQPAPRQPQPTEKIWKRWQGW
jgi:tRNA(fMet)-specific endonuclease VapC